MLFNSVSAVNCKSVEFLFILVNNDGILFAVILVKIIFFDKSNVLIDNIYISSVNDRLINICWEVAVHKLICPMKIAEAVNIMEKIGRKSPQRMNIDIGIWNVFFSCYRIENIIIFGMSVNLSIKITRLFVLWNRSDMEEIWYTACHT